MFEFRLNKERHMRKHNERCKECKKRIFELLEKIYGSNNVIQNCNLDFPNKIEEFSTNDINSVLLDIFKDLQEYRNYDCFIRAKKLPHVDFYIKNHFVLEFDESQHFTKPRQITLNKYPDNRSLGFNKDRWMELCGNINKKDNDPKTPFRDEQRAWYDTIRDFVPIFLDFKPTKRIFASDYEWCSLDATKKEDLETFNKLIGE